MRRGADSVLEALILAGGLGTRLRSVVSDVPKPMAPVNDRPFLEFLLDFWIENGVDRFVLAVSYRHEIIQSHFGFHYRGVPLDYSVEETPLGTGGGIFLSLEKIRNTEPILLINGDTFFDIDVSGLLAFHRERRPDLTMVLRTMEAAGRFGTVNLDGNGRLDGFFPPGEGLPPYLINGGIYMVDPAFLAREQKRWNGNTPVSLEGDLFPAWIKAQRSLLGFQGVGEFIDIGIPEEYRRCHELFNRFKIKSDTMRED